MRTLCNTHVFAILLLLTRGNAFVTPNHNRPRSDDVFASFVKDAAKASATMFLAGILSVTPALAVSDGGASVGSNAKITTGGASTLQSGRTIAITRGVNLDGSDFSKQNLKGVAFQQSIVRDANFKGANLYGASFFDATVDGSDFEDADLTLANVEMAQVSTQYARDMNR